MQRAHRRKILRSAASLLAAEEEGSCGEDGLATMALHGGVLPLGDAAVLAVFSETIDEPAVRNVWSLYEALQKTLGASVVDIVPAFGSVLVRFDPTRTQLAAVMATVRGALETPLASPETASRIIEIGVCFSPEHSIDLNDVASQLNLPAEEVVSEFCRPRYRVAFLGFTAGFPYLLGLPPKLNLSRLPTPRSRVPAGSVAFAAGQCGIYPRSSPGGWRIIGKTSAPIFDIARQPPALFRPGDWVRFHAVGSLDDATASIEEERT